MSEPILATESTTGLGRGNGQSYGDSSLSRFITSTNQNREICFDSFTGTLVSQSGATINEVLALIIPQGWILPVIPGSSFVTIGGAIASDVHGKNHSSEACFSNHVESFKIRIKDDVFTVFPGEPLFYSTCGGLGLTGLIIEATIKLKRIGQFIWVQKDFTFFHLDELVQSLISSQSLFANAWIDALCMERGVLSEVDESPSSETLVSIPAQSVNWRGNVWSLPTQLLFNTLYFHSVKFKSERRITNVNKFLFPLERLVGWNNLTGDKGILQLHFVVYSISQLRLIFNRLKQETFRPLLISMKKFETSNSNFLSFPKDGLGVAIDFKHTNESRRLVIELMDILTGIGGRIYLTKDLLLNSTQFKHMYPNWEHFQGVRSQYGALGVYTSLQSKRLGLD